MYHAAKLGILFTVLSLIAGSCVARQSDSSPGLVFRAPAGWVTQTPGSKMRVAQYTLPHVDGDSEDATVVLYFFGGGGGGVQANLDRWASQMKQADGSSSIDKAKVDKMDINNLKITAIDVSGTYVAEMAPGSSDHFDKPDFRLRAAVVETGKDPYYVKLVGPAKTVAKWNDSFVEFLKSFRLKQNIA